MVRCSPLRSQAPKTSGQLIQAWEIRTLSKRISEDRYYIYRIYRIYIIYPIIYIDILYIESEREREVL